MSRIQSFSQITESQQLPGESIKIAKWRHISRQWPFSQRSSLSASASRAAPWSPIIGLLLMVIRRTPDMRSRSGRRYRRLSCHASLWRFIAWCWKRNETDVTPMLDRSKPCWNKRANVMQKPWQFSNLIQIGRFFVQNEVTVLIMTKQSHFFIIPLRHRMLKKLNYSVKYEHKPHSFL